MAKSRAKAKAKTTRRRTTPSQRAKTKRAASRKAGRKTAPKVRKTTKLRTRAKTAKGRSLTVRKAGKKKKTARRTRATHGRNVTRKSRRHTPANLNRPRRVLAESEHAASLAPSTQLTKPVEPTPGLAPMQPVTGSDVDAQWNATLSGDTKQLAPPSLAPRGPASPPDDSTERIWLDDAE